MIRDRDKRPNIIVVLTDDHAQWCLGCYGSQEVRSPAMDALAASGTRMANAYTPLPVCSPARASFFTGLYPSQHGIHDYLGSAASELDWIGGEATLPMLLQAEGYRTGFIGKWHCGGGRHSPQAGFDRWITRKPGLSGPEQSRYLMDQAIDFIRCSDDEAPYFLFLSDVATHSPWSGRDEEWVSAYRACSFADVPDEPSIGDSSVTHYSKYDIPSREETLAQYYAAVSEIDTQLGRLVEELDSSGQRADTLLVYTADHGLCLGQHGVWGKGNGTMPLNMYEESIRIPMIVNQPGTVAAGQVRDEPVDHCDLFCTLLQHAGIAPPATSAAGLPFPGHDFGGMLRGQPALDWRSIQFGEYGDLRMARTDRYKLVSRSGDTPSELYDLQADPRETVNLYHDPSVREIVEAMSQQIDTFFSRIEHPQKNGLRVLDLPVHNGKEAWRGGPP